MLVQLPPCAEGKQALVQLLWASYKMCRDYPCYYKAAEWSAFWCSQSPDSEHWARWVAHRHFKQDDSAYVRSKLCLEVHSDCACFCILTIIDQTLRRSKYGDARFLQISHFNSQTGFIFHSTKGLTLRVYIIRFKYGFRINCINLMRWNTPWLFHSSYLHHKERFFSGLPGWLTRVG